MGHTDFWPFHAIIPFECVIDFPCHEKRTMVKKATESLIGPFHTSLLPCFFEQYLCIMVLSALSTRLIVKKKWENVKKWNDLLSVLSIRRQRLSRATEPSLSTLTNLALG